MFPGLISSCGHFQKEEDSMENWVLIATNNSLQLVPREIRVSLKRKDVYFLRLPLGITDT